MTREKIGKVTDYNEEDSRATIDLNSSLSVGDKLALLGPVAYQTQEVKKIYKEDQEVEQANEGKVTINVQNPVREDKTVYKLT